MNIVESDGGSLGAAPVAETHLQSQENLNKTTEMQPSIDIETPFEKQGLKRPSPDDGDNANDANDTGAEADSVTEEPNLSKNQLRYAKRRKIFGDNGNANSDDDTNDVDDNGAEACAGVEEPKLSKNQLRKLKRRQAYEEKRQEKKYMRKAKRHEKQERRRLEKEEEIAAALKEGREPVFQDPPKRRPKSTTPVPVTIIIDCQFEKYMMEKELVSLTNQVTRCYSDNKNAQFPIHMYISSFGGQMKERYETVLKNQHKSWKNIHFVEGDFVDAAAEAKQLMAGSKGGQITELLAQGEAGDSISLPEPNHDPKKNQKAAPVPELEPDDVDKSIVYLTADSPYTLDRLEPNTCYVIGGIIDKNREKGLCYKIARGKKVRTAKLPIKEFMIMSSRHILATNHVMEIMLQWLETGDWGTSFMKVIPIRKGGKLKRDDNTPDVDEEEPKEDVQEDDPEDGDAADENALAAQSPSPMAVEGDNFEEGLQKNSLDQPRWSAPPVEPREAEASPSDGIN
ncbi:guanine-1-methyltransferase-domain-containing protein [Hypomontagnella submonticulosa]|nr:guanine-1-methyltransferase-domain-containing protein [Hypomontagnella submonticulosa]